MWKICRQNADHDNMEDLWKKFRKMQNKCGVMENK